MTANSAISRKGRHLSRLLGADNEWSTAWGLSGMRHRQATLTESIDRSPKSVRTKTELFKPQQINARNIMPNSVHRHRVLATKPEKVYRAFLERSHWVAAIWPVRAVV